MTWGFSSNRLVKIQKRLLRIIKNSKYNAHTEPLFKLTGILKITDLFDLCALRFYYRYRHKTLPNHFYSFDLSYHCSSHQYQTRYRDQMRTYRTRTHLADKTLRKYIPDLINSTPVGILDKIDTHCITGFSNYYKNFLIQNYSDECSIQNCYICHNSNYL